jgi:hypothetical protein
MSTLEKDFIVRLESTLYLLQKWWNLLWDHPFYQIATILNPYYRLRWFQSVCEKESFSQREIATKLEEIKQIWKNWAEKYDDEQRRENTSYDKQEESRETLPHQVQDYTIEDLTARIFGDWAQATVSDELDEYILEPATKKQNSLSWWLCSARQQRWRKLSKFATFIFSFPPMSDKLERIFSGNRRTISWERSKLAPDTIEALECYRSILRQEN